MRRLRDFLGIFMFTLIPPSVALIIIQSFVNMTSYMLSGSYFSPRSNIDFLVTTELIFLGISIIIGLIYSLWYKKH